MTEVTTDSLIIEIDSSAEKAGKGIDKFIASMQRLETVTGSVNAGKIGELATAFRGFDGLRVGGLGRIAEQLDPFLASINRVSQASIERIGLLGRGLQNFGNVRAGSFGTIVKNLAPFYETLRKIQPSDATKLQNLVLALKDVKDIRAGGLGTTLKHLKELPEFLRSLENVDLDKTVRHLERVTKALGPLSHTLASMKGGIGQLNAATRLANTSSTRSSKSFMGIPLVATLTDVYNYMSRFGDVFGALTKLSNQYVEDLNLFTVAMRESTGVAKQFAEQAQNILGIDAGEFMRNQGIFKSILSGFGMVEDQAVHMSRNLTQVAYDISSLYNISFAESMLKLQSGISGELEPLRRLGFALDQASLQEIAHARGIEAKVNTMTQAEKTQLRYIAIMEQSSQAHNDFARTLQSPENAVRVLQQQIRLLGRALGNLFIPILQAVIPWLSAFVQLLTGAAQYLGKLVGFKMPKFDYGDIKAIQTPVENLSGGLVDAAEGLGGVSDALKGTGNSAKAAKKEVDEYKASVLGFDQLNILNEETGKTTPGLAGGIGGGGAGGIGGIGGGLGDLGLDMGDWGYNFLEGAQAFADEALRTLEGIADWFKQHYPKIAAALAFIGTWWVTYKIAERIMKIADFVRGANSPLGALANLLGITHTTLFAILGVVSAVVAIGVYAWLENQRRALEDLNSRLGDISLTAEEAEAYVRRLTESDLNVTLEVAAGLRFEKEQIGKRLKEVEADLRLMNFKITAGIEVDLDVYGNLNEQLVNETLALMENQLGLSHAASDMFGYDENDPVTAWSLGNQSRLIEDLKIESALIMGELNAAIEEGVDQIEVQKIAKKLYDKINGIKQEYNRLNMENNLGGMFMAETFGMDELNKESWDLVISESRKLAEERRVDMATLYNLRLSENQGAFASGEIDYGELIRRNEAEKYSFAMSLSESTALPIINEAIAAIDRMYDGIVDKLPKTKIADAVEDNMRRNFELIQADPSSIRLNFAHIIGGFTSEYRKLTEQLTPEMRGSLEILKDSLNEELGTLQESAGLAFMSGNKITSSLREGLTDYYEIEALLGEADGINYMMGIELAESPEFYRMLSTVKYAYNEIPKEMALGFFTTFDELKLDVKKGVVDFGNGMLLKLEEITPELYENFLNMGYDLQPAIVSAMGLVAQEGEEGVYRLSSGTVEALYQEQPGLALLFETLGITLKDSVETGVGDPNLTDPVMGSVTEAKNQVQRYLDDNPVSFKIRTVVDTATNIASNLLTGNSLLGTVTRNFRSIVGYASGGFPDEGELFLAREPGNPELVGSLGGKTAVMNNTQIVEAVSKGVYQAVSAAMRTDNGGDVVVNIQDRDGSYREVARQQMSNSRRTGEVSL